VPSHTQSELLTTLYNKLQKEKLNIVPNVTKPEFNKLNVLITFYNKQL